MSFFRLVEFLFPVISAASLSGSDMGPAGRAVDGAGVARHFDEGLDEHRGCGISRGPVPRQALADESEDVRTQVRHDEPWHDQEPWIVDHEG